MIMWATIDEFFYNDLAGIKGPDYYGPGYMTPGFRRIRIEPHLPGDLKHAAASVKTVRGMVSSRWKRTDDVGSGSYSFKLIGARNLPRGIQ